MQFGQLQEKVNLEAEFKKLKTQASDAAGVLNKVKGDLIAIKNHESLDAEDKAVVDAAITEIVNEVKNILGIA